MKPTKSSVFCPACGHSKILFESESKALNFIRFNKEEIEENGGYAPIRAYYCVACGGWHVTSKEKDKPKPKSYSKILMEDQGYYHLIGYIRGPLGKWGQEIGKHSESVWDPDNVIKQYWQAWQTIKDSDESLVDPTDKATLRVPSKKVHWIVRGKEGLILIRSNTGTPILLKKGEKVGTEFTRLKTSIYYKDGVLKKLGGD